MWNKFKAPKPQRPPPKVVDLPNKADRLAVYRLVQDAVTKRREEYATLLDPRSLGVKSFFTSSKSLLPTQIGIRKRQIEYLQLELLPTVSAALLLEIQDVNDDETTSSHVVVQEPVACLALLVSNMVLVSNGNYDARVRSILKTVGVQLLQQNADIHTTTNPQDSAARALYFLTEDHCNSEKSNAPMDVTPTIHHPKLSPTQRATLQFESMERAIATDILKEMVERDAIAQQQQEKSKKLKLKEHVLRGLQITTVGVVVGSIFAVTGGLAAPGLVAAITALGVHGSVMFATLTTTTALASMFGAVGGGLGAYKMSKRVKGLSEWKIRKETQTTTNASQQSEDAVTLRGLHAHVCVSGWLADKSDFQRPFGVQATDPPMSRLESLQRFFCVHGPDKVQHAEALLQANKGEEKQLWFELAGRYGKSPDDLLPLDKPKDDVLTEETQQDIYSLLVHHVLSEEAAEKMKQIWETSTMLVQMEAKNHEVLSCDSFLTAYSDDEENEKEEINRLKQQALLIEAAHKENTPAPCAGDGGGSMVNNVGSSVAVGNEGKRSPGEDKEAKSDVVSIPLSNEVAGNNETEHSSGESGNYKGKKGSGSPTSTASRAEPYKLATDSDTWESNNAISATAIGDSPRGDSNSGETVDHNLGRERLNKIDDRSDGDDNARENGVGSSTYLDEDDKSSLVDDTTLYISARDGDSTSNAGSEGDDQGGESSTDHLQIVWDWEATYAGEMYTVTWETNFLLKLCRVATTLFLELSDQVSRQVLTQALVGAAVAVPSALMTCSAVIDDPYQIISLRSKKAGIELAHCLLSSEEHRPVSLVGFSFGARMIFECLLELARHQLIWQERKELSEQGVDTSQKKRGRRRKADDHIDYVREPASIVEDVVLIGMPRTLDAEAWISCREIVAGRLVNCFNRKDWIVAYMINVRCGGGIRKTCGTHPIQNIDGVENFEVSGFASTHDRYLVAVPQILHKVGYSQPRLHS